MIWIRDSDGLQTYKDRLPHPTIVTCVGLKFHEVMLSGWDGTTGMYLINRPISRYERARHVPTMVVLTNWEFV